MGWGITIRIERFPVQPGLGTQPCYKDPSDLQVKIVKTQWSTSSDWGCPINNGPKLAVGQPNSSKKKYKKGYLEWAKTERNCSKFTIAI